MRPLIALILTLAFALPALASNRHALVVGIDGYDQLTDLHKARSDAQAIHAALEGVGFQADLFLDTDQLGLLGALTDFAARLNPGDEAVFYFAGHGVEIEGRNYLLPTDVPAMRPGQELIVTRRALPVDDVIDTLRRRGVRLSLLILDACRNNPFPREGTRSLGSTSGLARVEAPEGTFVMFSAGAGQGALDRLSDDDPNPNSIFTRALLPRIGQPGLPLRDMVQEVRSEVRQMARTVGYDQFPAVYDQLDGSFSFHPAATPAPAAPAAGAPAAADPCAGALAVWMAISQTDAGDVLAGFARTYAGCPALAALAAERLALLQGDRSPRPAAEPAQQPPPPSPPPTPVATNPGACDLGTGAACTARGQAHERGDGAPQDYGTAVFYYRQGCEAGDGAGCAALGTLYETGRGVGTDHADAARWYRAGAEAGNPRAMNNLGWLYQNGLGVAMDYHEAARLYRASAEAGDVEGMNNFGHMLEHGLGVPRDPGAAVRWYRASAEGGSALGANNYGNAYRNGMGLARNDTEAVRWFRAAIERGDDSGMNNLGFMYQTGRGVPQNDGEALRWYRASAEAGNGFAMNNLGFMYQHGRGVAASDAEAARWYRASAEAGNSLGMSNIGFMHQTGRGVAQDDREAARWYLAAAEAGNPLGMNNMGFLHESGRGVARDDGEALRWYRAAAEAGDAWGMLNYGFWLAQGRGTAADHTAAATWLTRALRGGRGDVVQNITQRGGQIPRETLLGVQRILRDAGAYTGALDGAYGPGTRGAMQRYAQQG